MNDKSFPLKTTQCMLILEILTLTLLGIMLLLNHYLSSMIVGGDFISTMLLCVFELAKMLFHTYVLLYFADVKFKNDKKYSLAISRKKKIDNIN